MSVPILIVAVVRPIALPKLGIVTPDAPLTIAAASSAYFPATGTGSRGSIEQKIIFGRGEAEDKQTTYLRKSQMMTRTKIEAPTKATMLA